ncbi:DUF4258 domain-containing protein [Muriicola sp.]|uniref:DUF4258 domain-containing protein n=1 Tax=Muriicola sp. TaxID=2020856 RepID=UPI003C75EA4F
MAFLKRLGYYMIGLAIGIVFLTFLLKKKTSETGSEFCYFPNCRVLKELRSKPMVYAPEVQEMLNSNLLDTAEVKIILREGDVIFSESNTKALPCKEFLIEGIIQEKEASLLFKNCATTTVLQSFAYKTP